ncbi:MAG: right-handed parallel beta-helix repeat-containing protein [Planctomycetota bacterium]|jgi:predicted outer membrane repeat protein
MDYRRIVNRVLASVAAAVITSAAGADTLYVDDDAAPSGDGQSWGTCCRCLQDALAFAADSGGTVTEIHVAQGTYTPDLDDAGNVTPGDRTATFQLINGVALMGGYAGTGMPEPDERNIALYETILSGDLLGDDLPDFLNNDENSYHVVTGSGTDATAGLDGFTIQGGHANGPGWPEYGTTGAGIINDAGSPTVANCLVTGNLALEYAGGMENMHGSNPTVSITVFAGNASGIAGGGMDNYFYSNATITDCTFDGNTVVEPSYGSGGGMYISDNSSPQVINCTFASNSARQGGGLMTYTSSNPEITGCTFDGNTGEIGGGILNWVNCSPMIENCTFVGNVTTGNGGAMFNEQDSHPTVDNCSFTRNSTGWNGGAIHNYNSASPTIVNCVFETNDAFNSGGAMYNRVGSSPTITACSFIRNESRESAGGAMHNRYDSSPTVTDCIFDRNTANGSGGAILSYDNCNLQVTNCLFINNVSGNRSGGLRDGRNCSSTLTNCTFTLNSAASAGGAITAGSDTSQPVGHTRLHNCILWDNTAPLGPEIALIGNFPAELTVAYGDVEGGEADVYVQPGFMLHWGPGNIDADPVFVDAGAGDYDLVSGSPAIDAGHNWAIAGLADTDLDGSPRFADDPATVDTGCGIPVVVDMGAYEYQGDPFPVKLGDIDGNAVVNVNDFLLLIAVWGTCLEDCCLADFNLDSDVGVNDFLILLANWG